MTSAASMQESAYDATVDYRVGSPHLAHWRLNTLLTQLLREHIHAIARDGLPMTALEVGAGHGGFTEILLSSGCRVTALEASKPSVTVLEQRFGLNDNFEAIYTADGSLDAAEGPFSLGVCASVLHHIPDYLDFLDQLSNRIGVGGSIVAIQDPLWYPRMSALIHRLDRVSYLVWRLGRGDYKRGLASMSRRIRGQLDETKPGDMVEYHVVRSGVDEDAVVTFLQSRFDHVELLPYWSNQMAAAQRLGEALKLRNTFAVVASGRRA